MCVCVPESQRVVCTCVGGWLDWDSLRDRPGAPGGQACAFSKTRGNAKSCTGQVLWTLGFNPGSVTYCVALGRPLSCLNQFPYQ